MLEELERRVRLVAKHAEFKFPSLSECSFASTVTVETFRDSADAGHAYLRRRAVAFNLDYVEHYGFEQFNDWIIHEIAHLVTGILYPLARQYHGKEFKKVCKTLGGSGRTRHQFDTAVSARDHVKVTCTCGKVLSIDPLLFKRVEKNPSNFQTKCCNVSLDTVIGGISNG